MKLPQYTEYKDYTKLIEDDIELIEDKIDMIGVVEFSVKLYGEIENGVALNTKVINDELYNPHISIHENIQGQDLTYKIYVKFIKEFGNLYSTPRRRTNNTQIPKIYEKIKNRYDIETLDWADGTIYFLKDNPDLDRLINKYQNGKIIESNFVFFNDLFDQIENNKYFDINEDQFDDLYENDIIP